MTTRLLSFAIWGLVAASAVFWGNRFAANPSPVPAHATTIGPAPVLAGALTRLFGAPPVVAVAVAAPMAADARFKLLGVVAPRAGQRSGWALLVVDDKPARSFALGSRVDTGLVVQSISHRQVDLGPAGGAPTLLLTLPPVAEAARGIPTGAAPVAPVGLAGPSAMSPPVGQPPFGTGQPQHGGPPPGVTQPTQMAPTGDQPQPGFAQQHGQR